MKLAGEDRAKIYALAAERADGGACWDKYRRTVKSTVNTGGCWHISRAAEELYDIADSAFGYKTDCTLEWNLFHQPGMYWWPFTYEGEQCRILALLFAAEIAKDSPIIFDTDSKENSNGNA